MKKIFFIFIAALAFSSMGLKAQSIPQPQVVPANYPPVIFDDELAPPPPMLLINCSQSSPDFAYYNNIGNYVPDNNTPTKNVEIALNIFQKADGSGNFQNTAADKQALIQLIGWLNANYSAGDGPSDQIIPIGNELPNRHIQFSLGTPGNERIYFYQDPTNTLWNGNCDYHSGQMQQAAWGTGNQADAQRRKYMNIYFTEGAVCGSVDANYVQITSGGSGYTSPPTVTFTRVGPVNLNCTPPIDATGTAQISGGQVIGVTITNGGGYYYPPTITFSGGGGSGATAIVDKIVGGASGCAMPPSYGESGDIYHVIYGAYYSYIHNSLWVNNIVMRHEIAHNLGLCHTYLYGGCSANCNTSDPNFWDDVFGNPSNCPHNADWGTDASDPNLPTPATHGKVTNNILGGNKAQGYASPKQIGEMHRALALKNIRKYVDPCTYTPLQPIIISSNQLWDFDIRLYSDLVIQPGFTLDLACKITMPCGSKIWVKPGATLKMENGSEIKLYDNATFFVDQGGTLIYNTSIINLIGNSTVLEIKGNLQIASNAIFTFTGNGYVKFSSPLTTGNIIAGTNSFINLNGGGKTDKILEVTQTNMFVPSQITSFYVTNGRVELGTNARIMPLGIYTEVKFQNVLVTSNTSGNSGHNGLWLLGQKKPFAFGSNITIDNCIFEKGNYGIYAILSGVKFNSGLPFTVTGTIFQDNNTSGIFTTDKGVTFLSCLFQRNGDNGWEAAAMSMPCKMDDCTIQQNSWGVNFNSTAGSDLRITSTTILQNYFNGVLFDGSGMLSLKCGSITGNGIYPFPLTGAISLKNGSILNMSGAASMYAGKVGAANNGITIESNCANTFYLAQGRNDFRPVSGGKITQGTVHNNCSGQIIASNNRWKNTLVQPTQPNDYTLQKCNCIPNKGIGLLDANPQTQLTCPFQIVNPKNPNAAISTALDFCPNCPNINTASFSNVKLNIAVQQAIAQMEFQNPSGNDLTAIDMLYQILTYPLHQQHERFDWLNDFSYTQIKRALGNAFLTGRTTDISLSNVAVQKVLAIQDSIIAKAKASGDSFTQFYTSTDQAFVYHLIDQQQKTLELLDAISTCMPLDSMQNAFLTNARKIIFAEYLVASGEAKVEDFDLLLKRGYSFTSPSGISTVGDTGLAASTHCINETIQFRPSTFAKTYSWNFGNGQTSTLINPSTTYTVAGTYTVTLTTTTNCSSNNTFTTTVTINPLLTAKFGFDVCNTSVSFHDSTSNAVAFHWNFGDGNTSDIESPTHDYGSFGTYSVCLTATNPCGSNTICQYVAVLPQDQWTQKANFGGTPRFGVVSLTIGNKGYMGTGYDGNTLYQDFWEYDPLADSWTQKATFPGVARFVAVGFYFSVGTKGYIGTGWNGSGATDQSDFWEYDQSTNVWTQKANFGGGQRNGAVGFSIGNKGYIGTGWNITDYPVYFHQDFWQYDPPTDTWTRKADLPGPGRQTATGFSIGSKGYIGLGSEWSTNFQDFWEYDQQTDTWTQKSNFPAPGRQWATAFAIGTKGYMGTGGTYPNGPLYNDIWEYDQATDVWTQKANVGGTGRTLASGFSIGTKGYLGTGYDGSFQNDFWQYTPASDPCTPVLRMKNNTQPPPVTINTPSAISVYPNPNNGNMTISYFIPQNKKAELAIYDMSGRQVKNYFLKGENNQLSISEKDLQEGIYFYNVISNGNIIKQDKIVVIK